MENDLVINRDTLLTDILARYPWIKGELYEISDRFRVIDTPIGRMLLKKATIKDLSRRSGISEEEILSKLSQMISEHK